MCNKPCENTGRLSFTKPASAISKSIVWRGISAQSDPGFSGHLAQVRGYRGETRDIEQMIQRVESDIEYINNGPLALDLSILRRTATVFTGKNAY